MVFGRILGGLATRLLRPILSISFWVMERIVPTRDDYWCFCTWQGYGHTLDNPRAVFQQVRSDPTIVKVILLRDRLPPTVDEPDTVRFVFAESFLGAYYLARCRVLFIGYAMTAITSYSRLLRAPRHLVIRLSHGVSFRRIGLLAAPTKDWLVETSRYAALVSSSEEERTHQLKAFAPVPRAWLTGLPRNNTILGPDESLPPDFLAHLASLDARIGTRRLVLYAPTWRKAPNRPYVFNEAEVEALTSVLERHNAVLGIHGHPNANWRQLFKEIPRSPSIMSVRDLPEVNAILRRVAVLVTDYSSIFLDFLLLDRPIVHFAYDLDEYEAQWGFLYPVNEAFGGPCAQTFDSFLGSLDEALRSPTRHSEIRAAAARRFHTHGLGSSEMVVSNVKQLLME